MINLKDTRWLLAIAVVVLFFSMQNMVPKESVAAIHGATCNEDADCPCWGEYNSTMFPGQVPAGEETAYGIGVASCENGACDMTWCYDIEPWEEYIVDKPWNWLKENPTAALAFVILLGFIIFWPKQ